MKRMLAATCYPGCTTVWDGEDAGQPVLLGWRQCWLPRAIPGCTTVWDGEDAGQPVLLGWKQCWLLRAIPGFKYYKMVKLLTSPWRWDEDDNGYSTWYEVRNTVSLTCPCCQMENYLAQFIRRRYGTCNRCRRCWLSKAIWRKRIASAVRRGTSKHKLHQHVLWDDVWLAHVMQKKHLKQGEQ